MKWGEVESLKFRELSTDFRPEVAEGKGVLGRKESLDKSLVISVSSLLRGRQGKLFPGSKWNESWPAGLRDKVDFILVVRCQVSLLALASQSQRQNSLTVSLQG